MSRMNLKERENMALIQCPECGKQISETTPACPHCGYQLSSVSAVNTPAQTKIGEIKTNPIVGAGAMFLGIICVPGSLLLGPFFIFPLIGAIALLGVGWGQLTGMQPITCPHCGKPAQISRKSENYKCPICKKRSVRKGDYLHPVM